MVKLINVEGASKDNQGEASARVLLKNDQGYLIQVFSTNLERTSNVAIELWVILLGLKLGWNLGHKKIIVKTNSKVTITLIKEASNESPHWNLIAKIKEIMQLD